MKEEIPVKKRDTEQIIIFVYSVYAIVLMFATYILNWPLWINPITVVGILVVWIVYLRETKNYRFRALLYSAVALATFALYSTLENSFEGILTTYCAVVVVLSILDVPEIVIPEYLFSTLLIAYHGFFRDTIPVSTIHEQILSAVQILSVFAIVGITHHLIKKHETMHRHMQDIIKNLRAAEQSKVDFLANVSHEIRTPVNTICGISEMILQEEISDNIKENTLSIQVAGRNLLSTISDVLDFSELESGRMALAEEPYHLTSTINDIINMAIAYKGSKDLELIVDCDAKIPYTLLGDEPKLRRVILNLVNNAIKFTESGCITVVVSAREEEYGINLCVKVQDTGIGIAEENLEKLFSSFNQVDTKRNRQEGGIGIGLPISKKIVHKMNGFISVKSKIGKGSEFQFVIPQKVVEPRPMVSVQNADDIHIIFYINTEKTSFTEIRDYYLNSIRHMMEQLEVSYHLCRNLGEFRRRYEKGIYTHALIGQDEYLEDQAYFDQLSNQIEIIMIQDRENAFVPGRGIKLIHKPFYVLSLAAVLNGGYSLQRIDGSYHQDKKFIAPEASVLVVDDNMMNLKVVEGLMRPYKIRIITASSGKECLTKLQKLRCDMIFMDHMMPEMDGVETARRIRNMVGTYFQHVPIVALTANAIDGAREMFLNEGFQEYISKPIEMTHMEHVLRKYIPADKIIWTENLEHSDRKLPITQPAEKKTHIDRDKGIQRWKGNVTAYEEILQIYLMDSQEVIKKIQETYQTEDWKNYTILVHSLKSNSFGIGAYELGEMAKALETAGKEEDLSYIHAHHKELIQEYQEVVSEINRTDCCQNTERGNHS